MKKIFLLLTVIICVLAVNACRSNQEPKKLYIEEGEYESQLNKEAQVERRGAAPVIESNYIFRVLPRDTYFYDEKDMPIEDTVKKAADYKEKRLWERPRRYKPGEYQ